ncbi:hypothetical protein M5E89_13835 [Acidaminococcus intestini]|nr:hypothetical protein M5E89_13835 [Acidaminococcus intestini]
MAKEPAAVSPSDEVLLKRIQEEGDGKAQDILLARYKELVKKRRPFTIWLVRSGMISSRKG